MRRTFGAARGLAVYLGPNWLPNSLAIPSRAVVVIPG